MTERITALICLIIVIAVAVMIGDGNKSLKDVGDRLVFEMKDTQAAEVFNIDREEIYFS